MGASHTANSLPVTPKLTQPNKQADLCQAEVDSVTLDTEIQFAYDLLRQSAVILLQFKLPLCRCPTSCPTSLLLLPSLLILHIFPILLQALAIRTVCRTQGWLLWEGRTCRRAGTLPGVLPAGAPIGAALYLQVPNTLNQSHQGKRGFQQQRNAVFSISMGTKTDFNWQHGQPSLRW